MNGFPKISKTDFPVTCTTEYRFSFNGMEKDDEVKGLGNSLDFGARIYDSRLARWYSLDPLQSNTPWDSPFAAMGNNPIFYIDKDGKVKITYITAVAKDGKETTIKMVDENKTRLGVNNKLLEFMGVMLIPGSGKTDLYKTQFDLVEFVRIDADGNVTTSGEINTTPTKGFISKTWEKFTGESDEGSGIVIKSKEYEGELNKYNRKAKYADATPVEVDQLIGDLRGGAKLVGPIQNFIDVAKSGFTLGGYVGDLINSITNTLNEDPTPSNIPAEYCPNCSSPETGRYVLPHGTDTTKTKDGKEVSDTRNKK